MTLLSADTERMRPMNHVHAGLRRGRSAAAANWSRREVYLKGDGSKNRLLTITPNCYLVGEVVGGV